MWSSIARIVERWRFVLAVLVAGILGVGAAVLGLEGELAFSYRVHLALFLVVFVLAFGVMFAALSGFLVFAEYKADREARPDPGLPRARMLRRE